MRQAKENQKKPKEVWKEHQSSLLKAFLRGDVSRFPFNEEVVTFNRRPDVPVRQKEKLDNFFIQARKNSKEYHKHLSELEVILANMLEERDQRMMDVNSWVDLRKNLLLDLGISRNMIFNPSEPEVIKRGIAAYYRDYEKQFHPYINNQGLAVPVNYASGYIDRISDNIPNVLGPTKELQDLFSQRKGIIGVRVSAKGESENDAAYLNKFIESADTSVPDIAQAKEFKAEILGILKNYERFLSCLADVYDYMVYLFAKKNLASKKLSRKILVVLKDISAWEFKPGSERGVADQTTLQKEIIPMLQLPAGFKKVWLPYLNTFRLYHELATRWETQNNMIFRNALRVAETIAHLGSALAGAIKEGGEGIAKKREEDLTKIEKALHPLFLFRKLSGNVDIDYKGFLEGLRELSFVVYEFEFNALNITKWLLANPNEYKLKKHSIDKAEFKCLSDELDTMVTNMKLLPVAFANIHSIEKTIVDIYEGKKKLKRQYNHRQILTHLLVPKEGWVKKIKSYIEELGARNLTAREKVHEFLNERVFARVFTISDALDTSKLEVNDKELLDEMRGELINVAPDGFPTVKSFLDQYVKLRKLSAELSKYLMSMIFLHRHEIDMADLLLKLFRNGEEPFSSNIVRRLISERLPTSAIKDEKVKKYYHKGITDYDFERLVSAMQSMAQNELFRMIRAESQRIRGEIQAETDALLEKRMSSGKVYSFKEQYDFLVKRQSLERERVQKRISELESRNEGTAIDSNIRTPQALKHEIRSYLLPQTFWTTEAFELSQIGEFSISNQNEINDHIFRMAGRHFFRLRFAHRFEEGMVKDIEAIKSVWPSTPMKYLSPKFDLASLGEGEGRKPGKEFDRRELDPVLTPENVKAIITITEIMHPELFRLKSGARPQFQEAERLYDQNLLHVLVAPPGCYPLRELPGLPPLFLSARGKSLGNIARTAFLAREYKAESDYIYTGAYYDNRNRTLIISADADDTNLFYYIKTPGHWRSRNVFSSVLMGLGMMVFHNLPKYFQTGDDGDNSQAWTTCLKQSRAKERMLYLEKMEEGNTESYAAQTSGLSYNIGIAKMKTDYYVIELEFASYYSEIMLELLSGKVRNQSRPNIVDYWFAQKLNINSLRMVQRRHDREISDDPLSNEYERRFTGVHKRLDKFLGLKEETIPYMMPGAKMVRADLLGILLGNTTDISGQMNALTDASVLKRRELLRPILRDLEITIFQKDNGVLQDILEHFPDGEIRSWTTLFENKSILKQAILLYFLTAGQIREDISRPVVRILEKLEEQERVSLIKKFAMLYSRQEQRDYFEGNGRFLKDWEHPDFGDLNKRRIQEIFDRLGG